MLYHEKHFLSDDHDWVVFVHGAGGSIQTFKKQIDFFQQHFNLLMVDLRDHGNSADLIVEDPTEFSFQYIAQDLIDLIDHLNIGKAHFIGVSMGSIFIRVVEEMRPELVKSAIVGGGVFKINTKLKVLLHSGILLAKVLPFHTLYKILAHIVLPAKNHKRSREIFIREAEKVTQDAFNRWLNLFGDLSAMMKRHFENEFSAPMYVIMGSEDHVFLEPAREYSEKFENVDLHVIEKCGHVCNLEQADKFNQACLEYLQSTFPVTRPQLAAC